MRRNPLLMTVMGNPNGYRSNPFVLIDSQTNKIIRTWRGSMMDRKPFDWARDAARRLGRPVFIVAHPYVPPTFRAGVEVSPLFYYGGPFQEVQPDGSMGPGPAGGYKRNPNFLPAVAGGIAGSLVANALSNPAEGWVVTHDGETLKAFGSGTAGENAAFSWLLHHQGQSVSYAIKYGGYDIVKVSGGRVERSLKRHGGKYYSNPPRTRKGAENALDKAIGHAWAQLMSGVQVPIMDIPRIFRDIKLEMEGGADLQTAVQVVGGRYRVNRNPRGRMCEHGAVDQRQCRGCRTRKHARRHTALCPHGISGGKVGRDCVRCVEKRYGYKRNGSGAKKVTMPIEKFAALVKARKDPALWRDFVAKCKGYFKWSHGTWPKKVTIEAIQKPGMQGMWISFDMGREPEKTYVMPGGTKRKGAWKHPWERMPQLRGDAEAGFILTKLGKGNRLTDFLHG